MKLNIFISAIFTVQYVQCAKRLSRQIDLSCFSQTACRREGSNMIRSLVTEFPFQTNDRSTVRQTCQEACAQTDGCRYFTWYERDGAFPFSCFLFSSCERQESCQDCISGPEICLSEEDSQCPGIEEDYGGSWFCFPDAGLGNPVPSGTKCIWQCPGQSSYHECYNGRWDVEPGQARCMCQKIGTRHEGQVLCYPPHDMNEPVSSGTYCLHTCHGHPKTEMVCDHSLWSNSPEDLSCHGGTNFTSQGLSFSNLGSLVSKKLRELRTKENLDNLTMKTKIGNEILTMKKVNSEPSNQGLFDSVGNQNFFQRLKQSSANRQPSAPVRQQSAPLRQKPNSIRQQSLQSVGGLRQQLAALQGESLSRPSSVERPPSAVSDSGSLQFSPPDSSSLQFQPFQLNQPQQGGFDPRVGPTTSNTPTIITLKIPSRVEVSREPAEPAIFPQIHSNQDNLDNSFLGFDSSNGNGDSPSLFQVSGQLQVGNDDSGSSWRSGTVETIRQQQPPRKVPGSGGRDTLTVKLERQMEKLHELENILRSSDQLSPVTLAMVENALRHLTEKRRQPTRTGFTELAKRFPQDFKRLIKSFSAEKEVSNDDPIRSEKVIDNFASLRNRLNSQQLKSSNGGTCVKPSPPQHGKVLCNSKVLGEGSKCILECDPGFLPAQGEIITCSGGSWSRLNLICEKTVTLLIGGYNVNQGELADVELYTPEGQCDPFRIAPLPQPRRGLVAAYIDGQIIACGGVNNTARLNLCWKYDPLVNTWTQTQALHSERHFGSIVSASGTLIVLGGRDGSQTPMALGGMEQWRNGAWNEVKTKMSLERSYQCAASIARDELVVTGGYSWNTILGRVESLRMSKGNSWKLLSPLNIPRYLHACSPVLQPSGHVGVLVTGGYSQDYLNSTEIYDPKTNSWRMSGELSEPRQGGTVLLVGGKPTIFGGFKNYDEYPTLVEQYDPDIGMWFPLRERIKKGRRYFAGVSVPSSMFPWCNV